MKNFYLKSLCLLWCIMALVVNLDAQRYVKATASGLGDGSSWTNASSDLQAMIDASSTGEEVWVAAGTYKPASTTSCTGCSSNRDFTFYIKDGVKIYGGFAGTEGTLAARSITTNTTTLSGDIGTVSDNTDNCYHVVVGVAPSSGGTGITVDGFTVTGGNANGSGTVSINGYSISRAASPGFFIVRGTNTINNNTISGNTTPNDGAGVYAVSSTNTLINNLVTGNTATNTGGAGMIFISCTTTLTNNTISGNATSGIGGGVYINAGTAVVTNNIFWNNTKGGSASVASADYYKANSATVTFKNNLLQLASDNYTTTGSGNYDLGTGAADNIFASDPLFTNAAGGNFSLQATSPAINKGNAAIWTATGLTTDLAGNPRPHGVVDMGALENQTVLPVEMLYFTGETTEIGHLLTWATATEENNAGFEVEKSTDGRTFEKIAFVAGYGTTVEEQAYEFLDKNTTNSVAYYRLKQTDFDGNFEYSNIISLITGEAIEKAVSIYPNPVTDKLHIMVHQPTDIEIINTYGQLIYQQRIENSQIIDMGDLPNGFYFLKAGAFTQKFVLER
jgi:hypothetical protein